MTFFEKNNIIAIHDIITDMTSTHFKDLKGKKDTKGKKEKEVKKNILPSDSDSDECIEYDTEEEDTEYTDDDEDDETGDYETVSGDEEEEHVVEKKNKKMPKSKNKKNEEEEEDIMDEDDFDKKKFRKTLLSLFPSEYSKKKYEDCLDDEEETEEDDVDKKKVKQVKKKDVKKDLKPKHKKTKKNENNDDDDDSADSDYLEGEEVSPKQMSIILSMGGGGGMDFGMSVDEEYEQLLKDDKHETCNSDDEKMFMKETYVPIDIPKTPTANQSSASESSANEKKKHKHNRKVRKHDKKREEEHENKKKKDLVEKEEENDENIVDKKYVELTQLKKELTEQLANKPGSKILRNAIQECRDSISKLIKKTRSKNTKDYYKLVNGEEEEKQNSSELTYFKKKCSHKEQLRIMRDLKEINSFTNIDKPYRLSILESNIPPKYKAVVLQKLKVLRTMEPGDSEYFKLKNWVDGFMRVPFGIYKHLNVNLNDGVEACSNFIENAKNILDNCAYGLNDAKLQILQMVGQWIANPGAMGTAIAIKGPMGTGKTTLVKDGISKILGREFAFIALGGAGDSSFLEGHSYTYEGSSWGKIIQIIMDARCMNPVIYFDELDKISDTPRGEEIVNILIHLTDVTQNDEYHDKYFSEVSFRLSQCLFIFSYNDESKVNPILKDRMYRINTKGYDAKDKVIIARKHLLPKIREQVNFKEEDIVIPDETLQYIISSEAMCKGEQGVRNLKRCLEIIHTKLNLFRLIKADSKVFEKDISLGDVVFPFTVLKKHVDVLIKNEEPLNHSMLAMYV